MRGAASLFVSATLLSACSNDEEPFVIRVVAPLGEKAFDPAVTRVELRVRDVAGAERTLGNVNVGDGALEVPDSAKSGIGSLVLSGIGGDGSVLSYGRTPALELAGLAGRATISLSLLVQRTSSLASSLKLAGKSTSPRCATLGSRYAVIADGASANADVIDVLRWSAAREEAFPAPPASLAAAGSLVLTVDAAGTATLTDLAAGSRRTPVAPAGFTFADVAYGVTIHDERGGAWIVGPTRTTTPSDVALRLGPDGAIVARRLQRARKSAAATWMLGRGLVIAYGDDTLGIELLANGATSSTPLSFPADPRAAGLLFALDTSRVLRIDEAGVGTTIDLTCAKDCVPQPTMLKDEPRAPRADDHATPLEGGGAVLARGGRVLRLSKDASKLELLVDAGDNAVCSALLQTGSVGLAIANDDVLRTISPDR